MKFSELGLGKQYKKYDVSGIATKTIKLKKQSKISVKVILVVEYVYERLEIIILFFKIKILIKITYCKTAVRYIPVLIVTW
jgi:hypothetical protein